MGKRFRIEVVGHVVLTAEEIWPDGDAPESPTPSDVLEAMALTGDVPDALCQWSLEDAFSFEVTGVKS